MAFKQSFWGGGGGLRGGAGGGWARGGTGEGGDAVASLVVYPTVMMMCHHGHVFLLFHTKNKLLVSRLSSDVRSTSP